MNKKSDSVVSCSKDIISISNVDKRLENWKRWIGIRISEQAKIFSFTGRQPCESIINSEECFRYKNEKRHLIDLASNLTLYEQSHRDNIFWKLPTELPGKYAHFHPLFAQITSLEKGIIPDLTHIGIPQYIKKEKGLCDHHKTESCKGFSQSEYRKKRENDLQNNIFQLLPHRPEMDDLIVIGRSIFNSEKNTIVTGASENILKSINLNKNIILGTVALQIENTVLIKEVTDRDSIFLNNLLQQDWHEEKTTWRIHFISKLYSPCSKSVVIHNLGTVPVKYKWRQMNYNITPYLKNLNESFTFTFDKNEGTILPREKFIINFLYSPQSNDISYESWEFCTNPILLTENGKILFNLHGLTIIESTHHKEVKILKDVILNKMGLYAVNDSLNTILDSIVFNRPIKISYEQYLCSEEIIFYVKNKTTYYYHPGVVKRLEKIYDQIFPNANSKWNLSIIDLRAVIINFQNVNRSALYNDYKNCCSILMKPKYNLLLPFNEYVIVFTLFANFFEKFSIFSNDMNYNKNKRNILPKLIQKNSSGNYLAYRKVFYSLIFLELDILVGDIFIVLQSIENNVEIHIKDN